MFSLANSELEKRIERECLKINDMIQQIDRGVDDYSPDTTIYMLKFLLDGIKSAVYEKLEETNIALDAEAYADYETHVLKRMRAHIMPIQLVVDNDEQRSA